MFLPIFTVTIRPLENIEKYIEQKILKNFYPRGSNIFGADSTENNIFLPKRRKNK